MALRKLDPPVGLFESWLDYFRISSAGEIEAKSIALLENVLSQAGQIAQLEETTKAVEVGTKEAVADPVRFIRGKDFVTLLAKLLRSSWGRSRGGAVMGKDAGRLARLLLFSVDSSAVDATSLMTGLRQRFAS